MDDELRTRVARLEARVNTLESHRPGRKALPILVSEEHVCGVDPSRNSTVCQDASLYRRQKGCKGDRCVTLSKEYYDARRNTPDDGE